MIDYNGPERRRDDTTQRLTRVETLVETVTHDIRDLNKIMHDHIKEDADKFAAVHQAMSEDRSETKRLIDYVATIANEVRENTEYVKSHGRIIAFATGAVIATGGIATVLWAVLKFVIPLM